ncbi:hypothetical protein KEM48_014307 [Puccinia striiformis f. sp. tritici PST-130]|nr:hypothetical protein Pst134EB_027632 [Puccinia striiformis f. sp. tritici]KAI9631483.1 hypothetical protein KEM48_014307 [Puccinia striiformis f. sp. tritici PST-130]
MTRREKTGPSSDHSRTPSGTMSDEEGTASTERGSSPLKLSPEAQMKIIEDTGILDRIPMRRFADVGSGPASSSANRKAPLVEFSTHEINSFNKTLKPPSVLDDDDLETIRNTQKDDKNSTEEEVDTLPVWVDRAFDTFLWSIPFTTVFVCLDVAIHAQYGQPVTLWSELARVGNVYPSALFLIHYSLHYHEQILANLLLFGLSTIGGSYMVYIMNRLSYLLVMRRVPPLGALWIYSVVRMHLSHAVLSLLLVALWAWVMNLSIYV